MWHLQPPSNSSNQKSSTTRTAQQLIKTPLQICLSQKRIFVNQSWSRINLTQVSPTWKVSNVKQIHSQKVQVHCETSITSYNSLNQLSTSQLCNLHESSQIKNKIKIGAALVAQTDLDYQKRRKLMRTSNKTICQIHLWNLLKEKVMLCQKMNSILKDNRHWLKVLIKVKKLSNTWPLKVRSGFKSK